MLRDWIFKNYANEKLDLLVRTMCIFWFKKKSNLKRKETWHSKHISDKKSSQRQKVFPTLTPSFGVQGQLGLTNTIKLLLYTEICKLLSKT